MHTYRSHTCGELRLTDKDQTVRISGWVHRKRDHGSLLFIDLRDYYGITQCVVDMKSQGLATDEKTGETTFPVSEQDISFLSEIEKVKNESVVTITGKVCERPGDTRNDKIP